MDVRSAYRGCFRSANTRFPELPSPLLRGRSLKWLRGACARPAFDALPCARAGRVPTSALPAKQAHAAQTRGDRVAAVSIARRRVCSWAERFLPPMPASASQRLGSAFGWWCVKEERSEHTQGLSTLSDEVHHRVASRLIASFRSGACALGWCGRAPVISRPRETGLPTLALGCSSMPAIAHFGKNARGHGGRLSRRDRDNRRLMPRQDAQSALTARRFDWPRTRKPRRSGAF